MHAYRQSLLRLWGYREEFDGIYPSHGTCPIASDYIMKLYDASGKVMSGRIPLSDCWICWTFHTNEDTKHNESIGCGRCFFVGSKPEPNHYPNRLNCRWLGKHKRKKEEKFPASSRPGEIRA